MGDHMRLNCSGYVFSCSSPPYLSAASIQSLTLLETGSDVKKLQRNIKLLHETIKKHKASFKGRLVTPSSSVSPLIHFRLSRSTGNRVSDLLLIRTIVDEMFNKSIVVSVPKYSTREMFLPQPSLKMCVTALHTEQDIVRAVECLAKVVTDVLEVSDVGGEESESEDKGKTKGKGKGKGERGVQVSTKDEVESNVSEDAESREGGDEGDIESRVSVGKVDSTKSAVKTNTTSGGRGTSYGAKEAGTGTAAGTGTTAGVGKRNRRKK
eukprot:TRINITY_DN1278_c0_g1_i1.p1 TRINITY_DN1278_c0_g1~~TRINITY_DN1278_c0_g1_i1.p1  ORF type:complete len:283 (+),score=63.47 TRINITY_DN1278_c0_g1_i1:52-849(+)